MGQAVVVLKKGEGRTLKAGGMWVILWAVVLSIVILRSGFV